MVSITFSLDDKVLSMLERFSWINWSEVVREKLNKRRIFEEFIRTGELSAEDQEFCDRIDWYPIDELELKEEYVKRLKQIEEGPHSRMTLEELDKLMGLE